MKKILKLLTIILLLAVVQTASAEEVPETIFTYYIDADGTSHDVEAIVLTVKEDCPVSRHCIVNMNKRGKHISNDLFECWKIQLLVKLGGIPRGF